MAITVDGKDGKLIYTVSSKDPVNLRLLAAADPSWKWSSSSSLAAAGASADSLPALEGIGDVDIWLEAGKSIIVQIKGPLKTRLRSR